MEGKSCAASVKHAHGCDVLESSGDHYGAGRGSWTRPGGRGVKEGWPPLHKPVHSTPEKVCACTDVRAKQLKDSCAHGPHWHWQKNHFVYQSCPIVLGVAL